MTPYDDYEDRLREVLLAEAETVVPAGDGLTRIRERVERRRARLRWLRPTVSLAAVAGVAAAAVLIGSVGGDVEQTLRPDPGTPGGGSATAPGPMPTGTAAPALTSGVTPIWPFTSVEAAQTWQAGGGPVAQPWSLDPARTAAHFLVALDADAVSTVLSTKLERLGAVPGVQVTLGYRAAGAPDRAVTVVHLVRLGTGPQPPYAVRFAGAYRLQVSGLPFFGFLHSPTTVRGTVRDTAATVVVELRRAGAATGTRLASAQATPGANAWTARLAFSAAPGLATLVARSAGPDGRTEQLTAVPVRLRGPSRPASGPGGSVGGYPATFVAAVGGRVAVLDSGTGAVRRYLTDAQPGGGVADLFLDTFGGRVYFTRGTGTCGAEVHSVPLTGGAETVAIPAPAGGRSENAVVTGEGGTVAYTTTACSGGAAVVAGSLGGGVPATSYPAPPGHSVRLLGYRPGTPQVLYLDSVGGATGTLRLLDTTRPAGPLATASSVVPTPTQSGCHDLGATYDPAGRLVLAAGCAGGTVRVLRVEVGNRVAVLATVTGGSLGPVALDWDPAGQALLLGADGHVSRLDGGRATRLSGPVATWPVW